MIVHGYAGVAVLTLGLLSQHKRVAVDYSTLQSLLAAFGFYVGKQALQCAGGSPNATWSSLGALNTIIAAYTGVAVHALLGLVLPKKGAVSGVINASSAIKGAITGVTSIAAGAGFVAPEYAVLSVVASNVLVYLFDYATVNVNVAGWDCFVAHGVSGLVGAAISGLFTQASFSANARGQNGAFFWNAQQLARQCAGISTVILLTVVATVCIYGFIVAIATPFGIKVWEEDEVAAAEPLKEVVPAATATATAAV